MAYSTAGPVVAIVPAAGRGVRLGESAPKAFVPINGVPMVRLAVEGLLAAGVVDEVVVVVPPEHVQSSAELLPEGIRILEGGPERIDSVRAGIAAAPEAGIYLVHDAARALTPPALIARIVTELRAGRAAVIPALEVADTIKSVDLLGGVTATLNRSELRAVQTPQGFDGELLRRAYASVTDGTDITDDAGLVERVGARVRAIPGDPLAFKITTPHDLTVAAALHAAQAGKTG
ncbi:2-C-methyl-D-erythritol 4-phosphate cytidylyltransferase [Aldersonia sp. NBC_00410]|uniref:2-C-methyl-D-erythritol 4-phosphate cytidylyltransferase n=1 Tax=Aldersonia sp. NBC_00410 TaxID=2975954 RepID=UPI0022582616|nr:2-C-methyl-D-erythritol 4-phosphate cytidylyltransferase [Aldersonia sp. NBC_00410]MCX5043259.1 2-C-methyl-D-erythritol 4-phosphate cytidylyltransferase [Aldersonia sp. NBC_00410]